MLFTELQFFAFFAALFVAYWIIQSRSGRVTLLVAASFCFYAAWDYRFVTLLAGVVAVAYCAQKALHATDLEKRRRRIVQASAFLLLALLGVFKYFNFFADSLVAAFQRAGIELSQPTVAIILPVGISFYVFQAIGYVIDTNRGKFDRAHSLLDVTFFVAFFPQLVAGPIVRAQNFFPQIKLHHKLSLIHISEPTRPY